MGFRMSVCKEADRQDYTRHYGDDHKLYGYYAFEDVAKSFVYICHFMKDQWKDLNNAIFDDPRAVYDYICYVGATDDLVLSEDEFKKFSELYLDDVLKNKRADTFNMVCAYMLSLAKTPGNKIIWWWC